MTVQEACQLILQSAAMGQGGEIFVLDMGKPVKIAYLAEQMITLSGKKPGVDVEIRFIGLRPGEKMTEELFHRNEAIDKTSHTKILLARHGMTDWSGFRAGLERLQDACQRVDRKTIHTVLHGLIADSQARSQNKSNVISL